MSPPKMLGTLIIIVMRAKNLPNLVKIGKQNPFATVSYGGSKKKTTTIDRGGQAPEWDEEFRFEIPEDMEAVELPEGAQVSKTGGVLPAIPAGEVPQVGKVLRGSTSSLSIAPKTTSVGLKHLRLACYADDVRDPKLIGEVMVELAPIIKKGTSDQWWELQRKGRYAGEVFLEMTFYSNAEPPAPVAKKAPVASEALYGGPGGRVEDEQAELDDSGIVERWERDARNGGVSSRASHLSAINSSNDFAADYPDADLAPLARSMSALSVHGALPTIPASPSIHDYQGYRTLDPYDSPQRVYGNQEPSHFSSRLPEGERRASYSNFQSQAPPTIYNNRRSSYSNIPIEPPSSAFNGGSEFAQLTEAYYASEGATMRYPQGNTPSHLPQPGAYPPPPPPQHNLPPAPTHHQSYEQQWSNPPLAGYYAPPPPLPIPPPLPQPPSRPPWQGAEHSYPSGFAPPPPPPSQIYPSPSHTQVYQPPPPQNFGPPPHQTYPAAPPGQPYFSQASQLPLQPYPPSTPLPQTPHYSQQQYRPASTPVSQPHYTVPPHAHYSATISQQGPPVLYAPPPIPPAGHFQEEQQQQQQQSYHSMNRYNPYDQ